MRAPDRLLNRLPRTWLPMAAAAVGCLVLGCTAAPATSASVSASTSAAAPAAGSAMQATIDPRTGQFIDRPVSAPDGAAKAAGGRQPTMQVIHARNGLTVYKLPPQSLCAEASPGAPVSRVAVGECQPQPSPAGAAP